MKSAAKSRRPSSATRLTASRTKAKVVDSRAEQVVPLNQRRLTFGNKWDYAPALEDHKHIPSAPRHELFVGGRYVKPHSGNYFPSINPATEETLTEIASG